MVEAIMLRPRGAVPPSALPGISPTRGEIGWSTVSPVGNGAVLSNVPAPCQSPPLWGRCPAGQRGVLTTRTTMEPTR